MPMIIINNKSKLNDEQATTLVSDLIGNSVNRFSCMTDQNMVEVNYVDIDSETGNKIITIVDCDKEKDR